MKANGRRSADEQLAAALATGSRIVDAATTAGVSESTVYRRLKNGNFAARVRELRGEMVNRAAGKLADSMSEAADVLRSLLASKSESVRIRAADLLIVHAVRIAELADLQLRVTELERRAAEGVKP